MRWCECDGVNAMVRMRRHDGGGTAVGQWWDGGGTAARPKLKPGPKLKLKLKLKLKPGLKLKFKLKLRPGPGRKLKLKLKLRPRPDPDPGRPGSFKSLWPYLNKAPWEAWPGPADTQKYA